MYDIRSKSFDERLSFSLKLKEIGNNYYNNYQYNEGIIMTIITNTIC
jgi:hypothetical protein